MSLDVTGAMRAFTRLLGGHGTLVRFSAATTILELTKMLAQLVMLRWIAPFDMGLWQSLMLVVNYSLLAQFGILNGLNRELPFELGAGRGGRARSYAATAQTVVLIGSSGFLVASLLAAVMAKPELRLGLSIVLVCAAATLFRNYLLVTYRAAAAFETLASIRFSEAILTLALLPIVYFFGFAGLAWHFLLTLLFSTVAGYIYRPLRVSSRFHWHEFRTLLGVGSLVFGFGYLFGIAHTFPRVILLVQSGVELVGLFAPVYAVVVLFRVVPDSLAQYVYPQMSYRFGATGDPVSLWPMAWKTTVAVLVTSIPLLIPAWIFTPYLIRTFIPEYSAASAAVRWSMFAGPLMGATISISALFSLKAWRWVTVYAIARVGGGLIVPFVFFEWSGRTLEGMAAGFLASQVMAFGVGVYSIYRATHDPRLAERASADQDRST